KSNAKTNLLFYSKTCIIVMLILLSRVMVHALRLKRFSDKCESGPLLVIRSHSQQFFEYPGSQAFAVVISTAKTSRFDASLEFPKREKVKYKMSMKLYVGNLSFNTSNQDLNDLFGAIGTVES